jgi:hypothetical protein
VFAWLRSFLVSVPERPEAAPGPFRFRPSLEYLSDRALPSAGLFARLAEASNDPAAVSALAAHWEQVLASHPQVNDTLVHVLAIPQVQDELGRALSSPQADAEVLNTLSSPRVQSTLVDDLSSPLVDAALVRILTAPPPPLGPPGDRDDTIREVRTEAWEDTAVDWTIGGSSDHTDNHAAATTPEPEGRGESAADRSAPLPQFAAPPVGSQVPPELQSEKYSLELPDGSERPAWLHVPASAPSDASPAPATGASDQQVTAGPGSDNSSTSGTEQSEGDDTAGIIDHFLPFDTAGLQEEVRNFLGALEPMFRAVPDQLIPYEWELLAALAAGAGTALTVKRWRAVARLIARTSLLRQPVTAPQGIG